MCSMPPLAPLTPTGAPQSSAAVAWWQDLLRCPDCSVPLCAAPDLRACASCGGTFRRSGRRIDLRPRGTRRVQLRALRTFDATECLQSVRMDIPNSAFDGP